MLHRLNVGNMKVDHRSRQAYMPETLLYIQKALAILQEMRRCTMPQDIQRLVYLQLSKPFQYPNLSRFIL